MMCVCVSKTGEAIALGFQHYILALGTAVMIPSLLVPYMGGEPVSFFSSLILFYLFDLDSNNYKSFPVMVLG